MNRDSWIVTVGRILQKLPLSPLRFFEKAIISLFRKKDNKSHLIILLALPRSGSTLTYQTLIHGLNPIYLSNFGNLLYQIPLFGSLLSSRRCNNHISDFQSNQGFVTGLCGPAEGLRYWSYWLNNGLDERNILTISSKKLQKRILHLKKIFSLLSNKSQPIVTGYLGHALTVEQLNEEFPDAIFVRLDRDPLMNALSILQSRKKEDKTWFSVFPKECSKHLKKDIYTEVASQVYWLNHRIDKAIDSNKTIHINYESLCLNPQKELRRIINFCNTKKMTLKQHNSLPKHFTYKKVENKKASDVIKLQKALEKLEDQFGHLRNKNL